ncbi:MMPL family transporter [Streptomyces alboflavus]|uniref:MMPL family transporter n=1 Tax=Streptomyces alboflavus TaxID=67267 RepID=UPI001F026ABC|nr:MMPL family transporter [Streptomyces alboflavus]
MAAWARWCYRHRLVVVVLWLGALLGLGAAGSTAGTAYTQVLSLPDTDSQRAHDLMTKAFPERSGDTDTVVWKTDAGSSVRDAAVRDRVEPALRRIAALDGVGGVASPYATGPRAAAQVSADGRIAYAQVTFVRQADEIPEEQIERVVDTAHAAARDGLQVEAGGQAVARTLEPSAGAPGAVGVAAAAVVLFLAFGSLFAMLLPIVTAVFAVGTGVLATMLLSHVTDVPEVAPLLGSLIGLGVGIDYALFIVTRHRRGILRGLEPQESAVQAVDTSGRAVLFAGGTVCVALAGMLVMNLRFLDGVVIAASLTVLLGALAAVTLLPALLGVLGVRVLSRRQRRALAASGPEPEEPGGLTARWSAFVRRRPRTVGVLALAVMVALAVPLLSLRLGATDQGNHQESTTTRQAYDLLTEGFGPGFNGPLQVVVDQRDPGATAELVERIRATEGVARVRQDPPAPPSPPSHAADTTVIEVVPTGSPQSEETGRLIDRLRGDVLPEAGADAHVGGVTAVSKDFAAVTADRLPYFVGAVVVLGFLLLLLAFRSLVVPLTAALMNLIAAAASFGVLVAVFQWGWGGELLGLGEAGPFTALLPVIVLALLFGLSTDYQVFLVSRMHEEWAHTHDNARAVRVGLAETGRVINCAALTVICVCAVFTAFSAFPGRPAFVLSGDTEGAMAGIGLAAAVALDAFVLRTALVPAAMHLIGRANWWLPARLDRRLPHLAVEPKEAEPPAPEDLEVLVAAALGTPRPPVSPASPGPRGPAGAGGSHGVNPYGAAHAYEARNGARDLSGEAAKPLPPYDGQGPATPYGPYRPGRRTAPGARPSGVPGPRAPGIPGYRRAARGPGAPREDDAPMAGDTPMESAAPGPYGPVVHGFIITPDGDPIHSVTLTLLSKGGSQLDRVSSLADGSYILVAPAPGVYLLAAAAPGYASKARHIMLGDGPLTYDLELVEAVGGGVNAVT